MVYSLWLLLVKSQHEAFFKIIIVTAIAKVISVIRKESKETPNVIGVHCALQRTGLTNPHSITASRETGNIQAQFSKMVICNCFNSFVSIV